MTLTTKEIRRFWNNVNKTISQKGCWLWSAGTFRKGYGCFNVACKPYATHRLAWLLTYGEMPALQVLHTCDTPRCVNPAHLFLGTNQDNVDDRETKGRNNPQSGEANGFCKISDKVVEQIRLLCSMGLTQREAAKRFNLSQTHVSDICSRKVRK